ncbi:hypothetical protein WJX72_008344 [[Myrmecia] bisecta]|uniref:Anaphase-promoting complex subunit 5 n=1 Tax=[Myrmecia] bisecta TaxID=41462 RepID=A0AAW1PQJ6_9CHLO
MASPDVHPHHVSLCVLLRAYLEPRTLTAYINGEAYQQLGEFLLQEIKATDTVVHPTLDQLLQKLQTWLNDDEALQNVEAIVVDQLGMLNCPDDLLSFFGELGDMLNSNTSIAHPDRVFADHNSAMGVFIRRCCQAFASLAFEATCLLYTDIRAYLEEAQLVAEGGLPSTSRGTLREGGPPSTSRGTLRGRPALDAFLNDKLAQTERQAGRTPSAASDPALDVLEELAPDLAKTFLVKHAGALQQDDYLAAIDSLHKYFDYSAGGPGAEGAGGSTEAERGRFQSALLSLGSTHAHFGHVQEALLALNETVRIAQQHNDDASLAHALAALCRILASTSAAAAVPLAEPTKLHASAAHHVQLLRLLRRCLKRAQELQLPHLVAFARLALAQFGVQHHVEANARQLLGEEPGTSQGSRSAALEVEEAVRDTAHLHQAAVMAAAVPLPPATAGAPNAPPLAGSVGRGSAADLFSTTASVFGPSSAGSQPASATAVEQLAGQGHLLRSVAWQLCGSRQLADASALTHLACYGESASAEDRCLAYAQLATSAAAKHGYKVAEAVLKIADREFLHSQSKPLMAARLRIAQQRALNRRDVQQATHLASQLAALAPPVDDTEQELRLEAEEAAVQTLLAAGRLQEAASAACQVFATCVDAGMQVAAVRLLLLLARIHQAAAAPVSALPYVLNCLLHASHLQLDMLAAEAAAVLADVWLALGRCHAGHAVQQLQSLLPLVLGHGELSLQAKVQLALAESLLAQASLEDIKADPSRVLEPLQAAATAFEEIEDWASAAEAQHLLALVLDLTGQTLQRNATAAAFHRLTMLAQHAS